MTWVQFVSHPRAVVKENHAAGAPALVQQLEVHAHIVREGPVAASHDDGREEQVEHVDQPGLDRRGRQVRSTHRQVTF